MSKILVIEDDQTLREDLLEALQLEGFEGYGASNGQDGLQLAQEKKPQLIICDINMPMINGFGVIVALHKHEETANIPLIFISARKEKETIDRALELGAVAYITKPYIWKDLLTKIRSHIINID